MKRYVVLLALFWGQAFGQISPDDFIADFESGNIANVQQVGVDSFTIEIRLDDNHGDTYGWYYFAIVGNQGRTATLFLTNPDGWQNSNCNPVVSADNVQWGRVQNVWGENGWLCFRQYLPADTISFAQGFPYTVTGMCSYMDSLESFPFVSRITLGYSVHDRPVDMVTITDESVPIDRKKTVWLISRQHPMESPPTFLLTGLMDKVLDDSPFSDYFRRDINLKIVPIVNVDGVAEGYSRHNVNGVNLNRDWRPDIENEQPEVQAVHQAIDEYLSWGNSIDLFMDLHAAPDNYDFGFRMSQSYTNEYYYDNQETFLHLLETFDPWQDRSRWRDLDTTYAHGVSCVILYDMYDLDVLTTENPWTRRSNNNFITIQSLYDQGPQLAESVYNYLYPLTVCDEYENRIDSIVPGQSFIPVVWDFDQRNHGWIEVTALCYQTADSEQVTLYREDFDGIFAPFDPVPTGDLPAVPGDGTVSLIPGGEMIVRYTEPDLPDRVCERFIAAVDQTGIAEGGLEYSRFSLDAYPNPFNSSTTISYSNLYGGEIQIYNIMGQMIRDFKIDDTADGRIVWDATDKSGNKISSGIYFIAAHGSRGFSTRKLLYIK